MSAEFNLGESFRYKARDNEMTSRPLVRPSSSDSPVEDQPDYAKESLRDKVIQSFDHLASPRAAGGAGVRVEKVDKDPYKSAQDMVTDIRKNRTLRVADSWGVDFPSQLGSEGNPVGHPVEKIHRPATDAAEEMQSAAEISADPAKQAQQSNVTNRYRRNFSSRTR